MLRSFFIDVCINRVYKISVDVLVIAIYCILLCIIPEWRALKCVDSFVVGGVSLSGVTRVGCSSWRLVVSVVDIGGCEVSTPSDVPPVFRSPRVV
jgi:hypothetical protein